MTQTYSDPDYANRMLQGEKCVKRIEQGLDAEHYVKMGKEGTWAVKMALFLSAWETLGTDAFWERYGQL